MAAQRTHPSIGRWYILFLISLMYLITYLDRVNISTVAPVISKEFGFDKVTMGIIFSAFVWAYALFQVPGGWLNDRFGPRRVLAIIVAYWSVMTAATAAATGAVSFVIVRFLFGIGEGVPLPVIAAQLGHSDTRMVEKHYGHLAPNYIADTVRAAFDRMGLVQADNVATFATAKVRASAPLDPAVQTT